MPNLSLYKKLNNFETDGNAHKYHSDMIMEATWSEDISSRVGYFYSYELDTGMEKYKYRDMHPQMDAYKIPVDIKFLYSSAQTFEKDTVTRHIQFKPSFDYVKTNLKYYKDIFENKLNAIFPTGLYVDIPGEDGKYNRWLVVDVANHYNNQFPTYQVLPCNKLIQYICDGVCYQVPAALRSQNS